MVKKVGGMPPQALEPGIYIIRDGQATSTGVDRNLDGGEEFDNVAVDRMGKAMEEDLGLSVDDQDLCLPVFRRKLHLFVGMSTREPGAIEERKGAGERRGVRGRHLYFSTRRKRKNIFKSWAYD